MSRECRDCRYKVIENQYSWYCSLSGEDIVDPDNSCADWGAEHPTNADIIREKSDEELAVFLENVFQNGHDGCHPDGGWLDWLRKEIDDAKDI